MSRASRWILLVCVAGALVACDGRRSRRGGGGGGGGGQIGDGGGQGATTAECQAISERCPGVAPPAMEQP